MNPRSYPNLIIPGAQKSGTTFLAALLSQHPEIFVPRVKEPAYFLKNTYPTIHWPNGRIRKYAFGDKKAYLSLYDDAPTNISWKVDASTGYLTHKAVSETIASTCGDCKIIFVLRNPVDRAISAYKYHRQLDQEDAKDFTTAISKQSENSENLVFPQPYIETGFYSQHIANWSQLFGEENIFILFFDDLKKDPVESLNKVCHFLNVSPFEFDLKAEKNESGYAPTGIKRTIQKILISGNDNALRKFLRSLIPADIRQKLRDKFKSLLKSKRPPQEQHELSPIEKKAILNLFMSDIEKLEKMTGRDLSSWKFINAK